MITLYVGALSYQQKNQLREITESNLEFNSNFYDFDETSFKCTDSFNFSKTERLYNLITFEKFVDLFNKSKTKIYKCW